MTFLQLVTALHIGAALTALATLPIPLIAKKGGRLHRRVGRVYASAMIVGSLSGGTMALFRLAQQPDPLQRQHDLHLLYASLLTGASVSMGLRALRTKHAIRPRGNWLDVTLSSLLVAGGISMIAYGAIVGAPLLVFFTPIGVSIGAAQLWHWLKPQRTRIDWWFQHMGGMFGSAVGALTAFESVNAPRVHLGHFSLWIWLGQMSVGAVAYVVWRAYYQRRFRLAQPRTVTAPSTGTARSAEAG